MSNLLDIIDKEDWDVLHCPAEWATPVSIDYDLQELHVDIVARLRLLLGPPAFEPDAREVLVRIAAAYCIMRLSTDVSWKLFAELFLNTTPRDIPGMRASAQAVAKLLMNNFPNIASELYKLYDTPLGQKDEAGPGNKGSKPKASKKKKKKKRQAATSANSPTVPQPDNAIPLSPSTEDGDLPALDSDSDSDPEFSAVVDSIARARGDDESCFSSSDEE